MPPKSAESSFNKFLETYADKDEPWIREAQKKTLYDMWEGSGSPYVKGHTREELLSINKAKGTKTYKENPRAFFTEGKKTLWDIAGMWKKSRSVSPDTLHIEQGNVQHFLAELAHAEQYKDRSMLNWYFGRGSREIKNVQAKRKHGEKVYHTEYLEDLEPDKDVETSYFTGRQFPKRKTKSIEYEAHQEIQPRMTRRYQESFGDLRSYK